MYLNYASKKWETLLKVHNIDMQGLIRVEYDYMRGLIDCVLSDNSWGVQLYAVPIMLEKE